MLQPVSYVLNSNFVKTNSKNDKQVFTKDIQNNNQTELANYEVSRAILNRNSISFRNLSQPIEVTDKYNKKIEGKDHLDLPNIHMYEYPDTNLQVILDENHNIPHNSNLLEAHLYFSKPQRDNSPLINKIICNILQEQLNNKVENTSLKENNSGLFTIHTKSNNINNISKINQIINDFEVSDKELENAKTNLLNEINSKDFKNLTQEFAIIDSSIKLKSIKELTNDINKLSLDELKEYYKKSTENTEARYFLTVNARDINKKDLLKNINSNINNKYVKHPDIKKTQNYFYNDKLKIIKNNDIETSSNNIITMYPYEDKDMKDSIVALFTDLILIFLLPPYHQEESGTEILSKPISFNNDTKYVYHNLYFNFPKAEFINLTPENALDIQKNLFKMINNTNFEVTLNDIKKYYKEDLNEYINLKYQENDTNLKLFDYGYDIFQIYELINSVNVDDIKNHIQKYLIEQPPIIKTNTQE